MATKIVFANQKGGCAKTTSSLLLVQLLKRTKFKVLSIDMDSQGNLSHSLHAVPEKGTVWQVLTKEKTIKQSVQKTEWGDCLCYSPELTGADKKLDVIGKEYLLKEAIEAVQDDYNYIIIDPPPAIGILTVNALVACDYVVIPAFAEIYSLIGISQLCQTIESIKKYCNPNLTIAGILLTRYNAKTNISKELTTMLEDTAVKLGTKVFKARIRDCVAVKEAEAGRVELFTYAPRSNASLDFCEFIKELIGDIDAK